MTATITACPACQRTVSRRAKACPGCGEPVAKKEPLHPLVQALIVIGWLFVGFICIAIIADVSTGMIGMLGSSPGKPKSEKIESLYAPKMPVPDFALPPAVTE